jgi:hypothetical protein
MKTKQPFIFTLLMLTCKLFAFGQTLQKNQSENSKYSLTISTFNHAELIYNGILTYKLDMNILTISRRNMFFEKDTILLSKIVDTMSVNKIKNIQIENLHDFYFNKCVMSTSGNEYSVTTKVDKVTKTIQLHHYYNKQIEILINELNKQIIDSLKINYLTSDSKQDCK